MEPMTPGRRSSTQGVSRKCVQSMAEHSVLTEQFAVTQDCLMAERTTALPACCQVSPSRPPQAERLPGPRQMTKRLFLPAMRLRSRTQLHGAMAGLTSVGGCEQSG